MEVVGVEVWPVPGGHSAVQAQGPAGILRFCARECGYAHACMCVYVCALACVSLFLLSLSLSLSLSLALSLLSFSLSLSLSALAPPARNYDHGTMCPRLMRSPCLA